jgi:uncharacterized NAD(P)/FAD-binding protein YdhS
LRNIVVVGGGFTGALFAVKMAKARPLDRIVLVERDRRPGRGVAYGACSPEHLLNVPVERMEVGLLPRFADWLLAGGHVDIQSAKLSATFVPRVLFGDYLEMQVRQALSPASDCGLHLVRGEVVAHLESPRSGVRLWDGRDFEADVVVLAIGNLPPRSPNLLGSVAEDGAIYTQDPWARDALEGLAPSDPILFIGTGLTTIDLVLRLSNEGHHGPMLAVSRHGLLPGAHRDGGAWSPFLEAAPSRSPVALMRHVRREAHRAEAAGVPWQRVLDAARPSVAGIWHGWRLDERRQFLRHARAYWDIHRHRMAPPVAERLAAMKASGQFKVETGCVSQIRRKKKGADVSIARRGGGETVFEAARVINCTGPRTDFGVLAAPLIADLRRRGFLTPDPLGLGVETVDCALVDNMGEPSRQLFALGPLARSAWWEITAVPEIKVQVESLVRQLSMPDATARTRTLPEAFNDLGAGI